MPGLVPFLKYSAFTKQKSVKLNDYISNTKTQTYICIIRPPCGSAGCVDWAAFPSSPPIEPAPWASLGGDSAGPSLALALVPNWGSFGFLSSQPAQVTAWWPCLQCNPSPSLEEISAYFQNGALSGEGGEGSGEGGWEGIVAGEGVKLGWEDLPVGCRERVVERVRELEWDLRELRNRCWLMSGITIFHQQKYQSLKILGILGWL